MIGVPPTPLSPPASHVQDLPLTLRLPKYARDYVAGAFQMHSHAGVCPPHAFDRRTLSDCQAGPLPSILCSIVSRGVLYQLVPRRKRWVCAPKMFILLNKIL